MPDTFERGGTTRANGERAVRCGLVLIAALAGGATESQPSTPPNTIHRAMTPVQDFSYHEGFEGPAPQVVRWAENGPSKVNFIGPSREQAFAGSNSLKLDVTLGGGSYHYWGVMVGVPCAGRVKLSARVLVAEGTTARVGFGTNMRYPPTSLSGCGPIKTFDKPTGRWELVEADLVARGRAGAAGVINHQTATLTAQDVGAYMDRWSLFVYGGKGKRAVVYVDEVRIEGQVPGAAEFDQQVKKRWAAGQRRLQKRLAAWRRRLESAEGALNKIGRVPAGGRQVAQAVRAAGAKARSMMDKLAKAGYGAQAQVTRIEAAIATVEHGPQTIRSVAEGLAAGHPFLVYEVPAISDEHVPIDVFPLPRAVAKELRCSACRGEYESVSVAVQAVAPVKGLRVSASDLKGPAGTIAAAAVDIYVVKWWYQAGRQIWDCKHKIYEPELLLKDDGLVRVDRQKRQNYLRSTAADGSQTYRLCSGPDSKDLTGVRPIDAETLQPVDIPAKSFKQFWLTVRIPAGADPGTYQGKVRFATAGGSTFVPLRVTVRPFELRDSRLIYSIYYRAKLSADGKPTIGSEYKSPQQYRAEIEDLKAHGVLYPSNYQGWNARLVRQVLEIRREAGLPGGPFFNLGKGTGNTTDPGRLEALRREVKQWIAFCRPFGYEQVYFYGIDEATGDRLKGQRATWKAVQQAGGKTFVACYKKTFEAMGDLLDCAVLAGRPDPAEAEKWHGVGSLAFCYAYPQVGVEQPETYRRNFGLVLWKAGFDGAMDYAYQHGFNHVWNDFDHKRYRDHNFTYPTINGVVGTIQWEGFREAVDDVRYITTLEQAIQGAPSAKEGLAAQARAWLDGLDPDTADLDEVREKTAAWIVRLR